MIFAIGSFVGSVVATSTGAMVAAVVGAGVAFVPHAVSPLVAIMMIASTIDNFLFISFSF
jgi:hypothetical protein